MGHIVCVFILIGATGLKWNHMAVESEEIVIYKLNTRIRHV